MTSPALSCAFLTLCANVDRGVTGNGFSTSPSSVARVAADESGTRSGLAQVATSYRQINHGTCLGRGGATIRGHR